MDPQKKIPVVFAPLEWLLLYHPLLTNPQTFRRPHNGRFWCLRFYEAFFMPFGRFASKFRREGPAAFICTSPWRWGWRVFPGTLLPVCWTAQCRISKEGRPGSFSWNRVLYGHKLPKAVTLLELTYCLSPTHKNIILCTALLTDKHVSKETQSSAF